LPLAAAGRKFNAFRIGKTMPFFAIHCIGLQKMASFFAYRFVLLNSSNWGCGELQLFTLKFNFAAHRSGAQI
jgi:hypothetical protein